MTNIQSLKIAVLLPCHNEAGAIGGVIDDFRKHLPQAQIFVYDNNSTDDTRAQAEAHGAIVKSEYHQGKGNVVRTMFRDIDADYYLMADGDGTYDAAKALELVTQCHQENCDMAVGKRISTQDENTYRHGHVFGNKLLNWTVRLFFERGFDDILSGYRVFSKRFAKSFPALSQGFEIETEMTIYALMLKMRVCEIDTAYFARKGETQSKLRTYRDGIKILLFILRLFKDYRPLLFFAIIAAGFFVLFAALFVPVYIDFLHTGSVPKLPTLFVSMFLLMLSVVSAFTGGILDSIARQNLTRLMQKFHDVSREKS